MILYFGICLLIAVALWVFIYTNNQTRIEIVRKVGKTKDDTRFTMIPFWKGMPTGHIRVFRADGLKVYFEELKRDIERTRPNDYRTDVVKKMKTKQFIKNREVEK